MAGAARPGGRVGLDDRVVSGTATATRRKRPTRCVVCLRRRRRHGHPTCATCAERTLQSDRARYAARVAAEVCTRCEAQVAEIDGRKYRLCPRHLRIDRARVKPGQGSR